MPRSSNNATPGRQENLLIVAVVVAGGGLGTQGRVNAELAGRIHSAIAAAAISFAVGLAMLAVPALGQPRRWRVLRQAQTKPWWWLGGLGGAFAVSLTAHAVPKVGVALATVCLVAGTAAGAMAVDLAGVGPGGRIPVNAVRLVGASLAIAAVIIGALGATGSSFRPLLFLILIVAGAGTAWQQAVNGQLRVAAHDVPVAAFISFLGGTIALVVVAAIAGDIRPGSWPGVWWMYAGGPLGVAYIALGAAAVRSIGVLRFALATVAGQLVAGVVLDAAWPEPHTHLRATTVAGALVTLVAVWISGRASLRAPVTRSLRRRSDADI